MSPTMTLKETVDLMLGEDAKERFKAEYYQLENRYVALSEMLLEWDLGRLDFTPPAPRLTYAEQQNTMRGYLDVLKRRAKYEGIEL